MLLFLHLLPFTLYNYGDTKMKTINIVKKKVKWMIQSYYKKVWGMIILISQSVLSKPTKFIVCVGFYIIHSKLSETTRVGRITTLDALKSFWSSFLLLTCISIFYQHFTSYQYRCFSVRLCVPHILMASWFVIHFGCIVTGAE